eukprot:SAG31_NODE_22362_length_527_cov_1.044393_1_plen_56_part_10
MSGAGARITRNTVQKSVVMLCRLPVYCVQAWVAEAADRFAAAGFAEAVSAVAFSFL